MYEQVEKTPEKQSKSVANAVSQRQNSNAPTSRFVDNRPEAIQMRKLRDLAKHSPQNDKLRDLHHLAAAHSVTQKKSNMKQGFRFVDNRPKQLVKERGVPVIQRNVAYSAIKDIVEKWQEKKANISAMCEGEIRVDPRVGLTSKTLG